MVRIETRQGGAVRHGGRRLIPVARSVMVRFPGLSGGLVWNRPLSVEVEEEGERVFLRIADRTRQLQWLLFGVGAAVVIFRRIAGRLRRREHHRRLLGRKA